MRVSVAISSLVAICAITPLSAQWTQTSGGPPIYYNSGNVGIGTSSPQALMSIGPHAQYGTTTGLLVSPDLDGVPSSQSAVQIAPFLTGVPTDNTAILYLVSHIADDVTVPVQWGLRVDVPQVSGNGNHGSTTTYYPATFMGGNVGIGNDTPSTMLQIGSFDGYGTTAGLMLSPTMTGHPSLSVDERALQIAPVQTASNVYGTNMLVYAIPTVSSGVTVTNQYGYVAGPPQGAGTVTNYYPAAFLGGNVGIGTLTPDYALEVVGDGYFSGTVSSGSQDVAEWVVASEPMDVGTVVVLSSDKVDQVTPSTKAYDTKVAGVVSKKPGVALGVAADNKALIATVGRVRVKVDATRAPVKAGDLLVTSGQRGTAVKSQPLNINGVELHRPGTLLGKALEPLNSGVGEILVLLSLQ